VILVVSQFSTEKKAADKSGITEDPSVEYFLRDIPPETPREYSFLNYSQGGTPWKLPMDCFFLTYSQGVTPWTSPWSALFLTIPRGIPLEPPRGVLFST
jgi:hypothetical protein